MQKKSIDFVWVLTSIEIDSLKLFIQQLTKHF